MVVGVNGGGKTTSLGNISGCHLIMIFTFSTSKIETNAPNWIVDSKDNFF